MNAKHLTTYMKDHFAGSVAAVELLDDLISSNRGKPMNHFLDAYRFTHQFGFQLRSR
jgi:hypothetical protein